jgi:SdpI/YfhL protein family
MLEGQMNSRIPLLVACGLIAAASVPLILRCVRPNPIYGFRTPRSLSSPEIWYPVNAFAGWTLLISAAVRAVSLSLIPAHCLLQTRIPPVLLLAPLAVAVFACFLYLRRFN